jgi:MoxR-like ATPase
VSLGYPDHASERRVLLQGERRELLHDTPVVLGPSQLLILQRGTRAVHVSDSLLDYLQALVARTRTQLRLGLSPRAAQGLLRASQAWALMEGESAVLPEHVQTVFPAIAAHRLVAREGDAAERGGEIADELIRATPVPV